MNQSSGSFRGSSLENVWMPDEPEPRPLRTAYDRAIARDPGGGSLGTKTEACPGDTRSSGEPTLRERVVAAMKTLGREPSIGKVAAKVGLYRPPDDATSYEQQDFERRHREFKLVLRTLAKDGVIVAGTRGGIRLRENAR